MASKGSKATPQPATHKTVSPTGSKTSMQSTAPPKKPRKPYEEIGAIFNGNEIKIRVPKCTTKVPNLTPSQMKLQYECTCDDDESVCSESCGMENEGPQGNKLNFKLPDEMCEAYTNRKPYNSEVTYSKMEAHDHLCETCNVTPENAPNGVKAKKIKHPDKDVFLLKIGKQTDEPNRTGNIEVKLVTPRAPAKRLPPSHACKLIQCEEIAIPTCCMPCRGPTCRPKAKKGSRARR